MDLGHVVLGPLEAGVGEVSTAHAGKHHGDQRRRDATLERLVEHALLDPTLLQPQALLPGPLFFLLASILFLLGLQPGSHRLLGVPPLGRRGGQLAQGLAHRRSHGRRRAWRRRRWPRLRGRGQGHGRRRRQAAMGGGHGARRAGRARRLKSAGHGRREAEGGGGGDGGGSRRDAGGRGRARRFMETPGERMGGLLQGEQHEDGGGGPERGERTYTRERPRRPTLRGDRAFFMSRRGRRSGGRPHVAQARCPSGRSVVGLFPLSHPRGASRQARVGRAKEESR